MTAGRPLSPLRASLLMTAALALSACAEDEAPCPAVGSYALAVRVVDETGMAVLDAVVEAGFDGRSPTRSVCAERAEGTGCKRWDVGGLPGTFVLRASRADGSSPTERTVVVGNAGTASCPSPAKQDVELLLTP